jgi:hypothetical protein
MRKISLTIYEPTESDIEAVRDIVASALIWTDITTRPPARIDIATEHTIGEGHAQDIVLLRSAF